MSSRTYKITLTEHDALDASTRWCASIEMEPGFRGHGFDASSPEQALAGLAIYLATLHVFEE